MGLAVGLGYLGLRRHRVLLLGIPLGAVALLLIPSDLSAAALASESGAERVTSWRENVTSMSSNPLGAGIAASGSASEKVAELRQEGATFQPDNYYYKIAFELGVLGLWMLTLLLVAAFRTADIGGQRLPSPDATFARSTAAMVLGAATASLVATYFEIFPMEVYFWLLISVTGRCDRALR
jgi:hypothetical protein